MPQVLTDFGVVKCAHGLVGTSTASSDKWSIDGHKVMLENDTGTFPCTFPYPCGGYTLKSMGLNATTIDGRKVILITDFNLSTTGLPITMTESHTTYDDSIPAPIPAGQPTPALAPELIDFVPPIVTVTPAEMDFTITTSMPASVPVTYTLTAQNPLKWILTHINEPVGSSTELTTTQPAGLVLAPAGGTWDSPSLIVMATMSAAFMASLAPGKHHFYLTGVSKRGLTGFAEFVLKVTP